MSSKRKTATIVNLISLLPQKELNMLAKKTNVNHYVKVLDGSSMFYLLLYSLVECQRNSLRTMEDIFNSPTFKFLFNLDQSKTVKYNSISERLSVINLEFFEKAYELIYNKFSKYYRIEEIEGHNLIRVDSSMVAEASTKLKQGLNIGSKKDGKKQIKYTVAYDGSFPCMSKVFTTKEHLSEDITIPKVVRDYAKKEKHPIFVFDRGVSSRKVFEEFTKSKIQFVCRIREDVKHKIISKIEDGEQRAVGTLNLEKDLVVKLFGAKHKQTEENYRLITTINPSTGNKYFFITNVFTRKVEEILEFYKKRWDIEVFFRFLKQELNFSHITSTSDNGMRVMMYMTLITSMLVLLYKRLNNIGYKTAVRRMSMELNELIIKLVVQHCGGDPSLVFR